MKYWWYHLRFVQLDKIWMWLVWKLPRPLIMWASVRLIAHATTGQWESTVVPELSAMEALKRWKK